MEQTPHYPDLVINGVGSASGGQFNRVQMDGVGKVSGDVQAEECRLNGMTTIRGRLHTKRLEVSGRMKIDGSLTAGTARVEGYADAAGSLSGEQLTLRGLVRIEGDCEAERLDAEGGLEIGGLLNAGFIDIRMAGRVKAKEIGCESIRVRKLPGSKWKSMFSKMFGVWKPELTAGTIEGEEIDLEHATASVVRGNRVTIGPGCRIDRVEYRTELIKHKTAHVGEERKSGDGSRFA